MKLLGWGSPGGYFRLANGFLRSEIAPVPVEIGLIPTPTRAREKGKVSWHGLRG
jgi:hypothetical protein